MHKKKNVGSLLSAKQLLLIQNASAVWTSFNLWNQTLKAIMLNNELNKYWEKVTAATPYETACQKSDDKLQIKMEMQLKEHCIKKTNILLSHFNWNTYTHSPKTKSNLHPRSCHDPIPWQPMSIKQRLWYDAGALPFISHRYDKNNLVLI